VALRLRLSVRTPLGTRGDLLDVGAGGSLSLPPNLDVNLGPIGLFPVGATSPMRGEWRIEARALDPATGALIGEDVETFVIR
jgi:hypothetical protein